jgi:peptide/nickel transport system ATP-binding protein
LPVRRSDESKGSFDAAGAGQPTEAGPLLEIEDLVTVFRTSSGDLTAVKNLSYSVDPGEMLGIVGESGSGKSVSALSVLGLLPRRIGEIVDGSIRFRGEELVGARERRLRQLRGKEIAMIFQESALNPSYTVGHQLVEMLRLHEDISASEAKRRAIENLDMVGIAAPAQRFGEYPHQLSGGMRQRVMIAMALACHPALLFADEPTTALDVTIQAQILQLLRDLRGSHEMAMVLITHDLGVVAESVDRVVVMYAGRVMEEAPVDDLFSRPLHPYTEGLLASSPSLDDVPKSQLRAIPGSLPDPYEVSRGCPFAPRCEYVEEHCRSQLPPLEDVGGGRKVACFRHRELELVGDQSGPTGAGGTR